MWDTLKSLRPQKASPAKKVTIDKSYESVKVDGLEEKDLSMFTILNRVFRLVRPYPYRVLLAMLLSIPIGMLDGAIAYSLKPYIDGIQGESEFMNVSYIPLIIVGFTLLQGALNYYSITLNGWVGYRMMNDLRDRLFDTLQRLDVPLIDRLTSGWVIGRFFRDPESLQINLLNNIKLTLTRFCSAASLSYVLLTQSWQLAVVAISVLLLTLLPATFIRRKIKHLSRQKADASGDLITFFNETCGGIRVTQGFNLQKPRLKEYHRIQRRLLDNHMRETKTAGWLQPIMHVTSSLGIAIILWYGTSMVVEGTLTTGTFAAFLAALVMLYNPLKSMSGAIMETQMSVHAAQRVFSILDHVPEMMDKAGAVPFRGLKESLVFDNVVFGYDPAKPVLHGVSFTVKAGETLALVGQSGGGKSTIANLIPRFYDIQSGQILMDDKPLDAYQIRSLRGGVALVTQENFLFNHTIRYNLMAGNPYATDEQLWKALDQAYLGDFVRGLPGQLDTLLGDRGMLISGGQRQRMAIARALLKDASLVILDEATSALDNETEYLVQKALERLMENRTVIVIAHRLSTIQQANRILVVDAGRIMESGTHEELMGTDGGTYQKLYQSQFATQAVPEAPPQLQAATA